MATFARPQRTPQTNQRKPVVAAAASPKEVEAVLANVASVVAAEPDGVDAGVLPAKYAAAHGAPLAPRALGFKKLGDLLKIGEARGLFVAERRPRVGGASGAWTLRAPGATPVRAPDDAPRALLGFYLYARPPWSDDARDASCAWLEAFCTERGLGGRARVAGEGVNAALSGRRGDVDDAVARLSKLKGDGWPRVHYKIEPCAQSQAWPGLSCWTADELCGFGADAERRRALDAVGPGAELEPAEFHARALAGDGAVLVDVRNRYETAVGRFAAPRSETLDPDTRTFADFGAWLDRPETRAKLEGRDVLMYCTGGVRCERATAYARSRLPDPDRVYHLRGGIVGYLDSVKGDEGLFKGANYVFDRRARHGAAPRGSADVLGTCLGCGRAWDVYRGAATCGGCRTRVLLCDSCLSKNGAWTCDLCVDERAATPEP
mmetsp:Transcript_6207/g.19584  ORF Transcript_6207/g.19584 Transcript_6207/m.19584 type:complete len:434 (+) Transcript_6207:85-1386(+)